LKLLESIFNFLSSLKLAVFIIISFACVAAVGTITEAKYDAEVAGQLVYRSIWMYSVLGALIINLIAVMISRWPWQRRHVGFVMAHIGIITTLFGAYLTQTEGVDGTLSFEPGQSQKYVVVKNRDLIVYATMDGDNVRPVFQEEVNFLKHPPSPDKPLIIPIGSEELDVVDYYHYAYRESEISPSDRALDGPAVRFQLENERVNQTEWLRRETRRTFQSLNLGPAQVVLSDGSYKSTSDKNEIVLSPGPSNDSLRYAIYTHSLLSKRGVIKQSEAIETGWMGLKLHMLRYLPKATEKITYIKSEHPSETAESAVKIKFHGEAYWLGLNSLLRLYGSDRMYMISYGHRRLPLDFSLTLKDFRVGRYQGTQRASSYESDVDVPGRGLTKISMNEPLKYAGFTFYQASFEQDPAGVMTSILSVNYDPGRWIKYIGSMMIVIGSSILFWFRKQFYKKAS
jgi:hypothetical protein